MKTARIAVLFVAIAAAGGAFVIASRPAPAPAPQVAAPVQQPSTTDDVLVTAKELPIGRIIAPNDLTWQPWPKEAVAAFMIRRDDKVIGDLSGSIVRASFYEGEPVRRERLIKGTNSGFLSAVLPSGARAVAINIDSQGSTSAGGFVLPNDRVDVVRTAKPATSSPNANNDYVSETLLTNVRVLAIGQNVQDKNGQTVVVGSTATLELDPVQAETVILAQRTGQLSLTLRSLLDASGTEAMRETERSTKVIRFGVDSEGANH